ncbi:DNA polymerase III subunit delta [Mangrovibacterium marinum]|uniref:DNA polymerase III subunit delta n=1 Tax=Mangrovibacterium marinum TaxID=1639118 RepID=A0A2T5BZW1_9BACT|nr:DNA polymerase III subunit delta [Mangrovibacterium marinum]PTN07848.1 DNA polymerase III delta subunit [Mangrovibacterium marinum]
MTFDQILTALKKKEYRPVYFLMGEESYFIDQISDYITEHVLTDAEKGFNQHILYGKDTDIDTIITYARRFPMMASHQVVVVREAQNIKKIEELEAYIKNPLQSTILVINYKYKSLDKRKSFSKLVDKNGVLFESKRIYDNKLPDWIKSYLANRSFTIVPQAAQLLAEYLGSDLSKVSNELEKLIISLPAKTQITADHIEKNIGISKDYNIFELQNALGQRNILKSNQIINHFAANPNANPLPRTISSLYQFFMKLLTFHFLDDKSPTAAASKLGVNSYFVKDYIAAARQYPIRKLVAIIGTLREFDMKSKGLGNVSSSAGDLQKELIYKILHD